MRSTRWVVVVCVSALLMMLSCSALRVQRMSDDLNKQVNIMTYDDALRRFGPPTFVGDGDRVKVATWGDERSGIYAQQLTYLGSVAAVPISHGWVLNLTFDKATTLLVDWAYREW